MLLLRCQKPQPPARLVIFHAQTRASSPHNPRMRYSFQSSVARSCFQGSLGSLEVVFPLGSGVWVATGHGSQGQLFISRCHRDDLLVQACEATAVGPAFGSRLGSKGTRLTVLGVKCKENIF